MLRRVLNTRLADGGDVRNAHQHYPTCIQSAVPRQKKKGKRPRIPHFPHENTSFFPCFSFLYTKMWKIILIPTILAALASACTIPTTPLSNTITKPFRIQVQNASYPAVNNLFMNLL